MQKHNFLTWSYDLVMISKEKFSLGHLFQQTLFYKRIYLSYLCPMFPFYTPWKHQKTRSFKLFSGGVKWEHWPEMGWFLKKITLSEKVGT